MPVIDDHSLVFNLCLRVVMRLVDRRTTGGVPGNSQTEIKLHPDVATATGGKPEEQAPR